ncbi:MAG: hypothetical protein ABJL94_09160 [Rhizobiaceae bacterium]
MRSFWVALVLALTSVGMAEAKDCIIQDPNDTSLNVRDTPNGKVVNALRNGRKVKITSLRNDSKGRPWGFATGNYKGTYRDWGWVFMALVDCTGKPRPTVVKSAGSRKSVCTIADPNDTALNVRGEPNGDVTNRLRNGRRVDISSIYLDDKNRPWGKASGMFKGQYRDWGWIFMDSVNCQANGKADVIQLHPGRNRYCTIADPTDNSLNVRDAPNGNLVNRLRNGRFVTINKYQNDAKGRPWGFASGNYQGEQRKWGWVFMQSLDCGSPTEFDDRKEDFWRADKILKDRGFSASARISVLQGGLFAMYTKAGDPWGARAGRWGQENVLLIDQFKYRYRAQAGVVVYTEFSPDTGRKITGNTFTELAKNVSTCFKNSTPWRDCKMNYHPVDGCFLTKKQSATCAKGPSSDWRSQCWNYEKGPGIILPFQATSKSQIKLSKAKVLKPSAVTQKPKKPVINPLGRPVCQHAYANGPACLGSDGGC